MDLPDVSISLAHHNRAALVGQSCPDKMRQVLEPDRCTTARETISQWADYKPTALHRFDHLAAKLELDSVYYKDESTRFGLGSFKALGGAYGVQRVLHQALAAQLGDAAISLDDINQQRYPDLVDNMTVVTATDGNHGRSVAWGAQRFGCQCVIYMHENVSPARQQAVEIYGARVERVAGNYDDSVHQVDHDARQNDWQIVSDTSYPGYMEIPCDVMAGYTVMTTEAMDQLPNSLIPTHVFIQGGCGGLAGAVCADLWFRYGADMPHLVVVEPQPAACLYQSALAGKPQVVHIVDESLMAGLSCGEVSLLGWDILKAGARHFLTISDAPVAPLMRLMAAGAGGATPVVAGESAIAGLAGLIGAVNSPQLAREIGLDTNSRVLLFGTEGATDPALYRELTGARVEEVIPPGSQS